MSRKELTARIITISAILVTAGAAMLPNSFKEQYPWIWQVLVGIGGFSLLIALTLLITNRIWKMIGELFPIRIIRELILQVTKPSQFLYIQNPKFEFLHMHGGENSRTWSSEFNIVNCLFRNIRGDRMDIIVTHPIKETWVINDKFCLTHFASTKIGSGHASMSDTSFHYLEKQSKLLKQKGDIPIRCSVAGFKRNKKIFVIDNPDCYEGKLNEWGQNNATT